MTEAPTTYTAGIAPADPKMIPILVPAEHLPALIRLIEASLMISETLRPKTLPGVKRENIAYIAGMVEALKMELTQ